MLPRQGLIRMQVIREHFGRRPREATKKEFEAFTTDAAKAFESNFIDINERKIFDKL